MIIQDAINSELPFKRPSFKPDVVGNEPWLYVDSEKRIRHGGSKRLWSWRLQDLLADDWIALGVIKRGEKYFGYRDEYFKEKQAVILTDVSSLYPSVMNKQSDQNLKESSMKFDNDFSKVKVGDKLWAIQLGVCFVLKLEADHIICKSLCHDDEGIHYQSTYDIFGKWVERDYFQSLFFENPFEHEIEQVSDASQESSEFSILGDHELVLLSQIVDIMNVMSVDEQERTINYLKSRYE